MKSPDEQASIKALLKQQRQALGLTQQQVADAVEIPRITYHRIESDTRRIRLKDLIKLHKLFDIETLLNPVQKKQFKLLTQSLTKDHL